MIVPRNAQLGRMVRSLGWPLALFLVWDFAVVVSYVTLHHDLRLYLPVLPLSLLGSALVLFLGFRNNSAYARWWEARTLWGATVNASRSFGRQVLSFIPDTPATVPFKREVVQRQIAYVHALRCALRRQDCWDEIGRHVPGDELTRLKGMNNLPNAILAIAASRLAHARAQGWIDSIQQTRLEATMVDLSNAQGGMERIKNTPLPRQYTFFPRFFVHVFCVLLPVGLVESLGFYTPLASFVVGFMLLAIEQIGDDIQDPFENTVNDVPLTAICRTIEIDLLQSIGDMNTPPPARPEHDVLW
ncbi:bestrophin family protein [Roseomonas elaeocarpi]|uniref:Bestrophin family protein n=1 Tax=Roseomonas elaeocarpi TaxID=907779 RepID=A0ABV6JT88_9PROT